MTVKEAKVSGVPALLLVLCPMVVGYIVIIKATLEAVL